VNRRVFIFMAGLGLVLAAVLVLSRVDFGGGRNAGGLHAPGLAGRIGDLESLKVVHAGNEALATVVRGERGWAVAEKGGHPANFERLRSVLDALSQARRVERKTALPEFYSRLGVDDPSGADATGYLLELDYGGRHPPEGFIVGQRAGAGMAYIRTVGEAQSWMVSADFDLSDLARDWLDREVIDIASGDIRRVVLDRGGGDVLEIAKEDAGDINFTPADLPEGRELSYGSVANSIAGALANVEANDVRPAAEAGALPAAAKARYETFDGLEVRLDIREEAPVAEAGAAEPTADAPRYWALFSAVPLMPEAAGPPETPANKEGGDADHAGETTEAGDATDAAAAAAAEAGGSGNETASEPPAPSPQERAADINAKLGGWAYELPAYKSDQWFKAMDDLLKEE